MTANCSVIISLNCDELYAPKCNAKGKFKKIWKIKENWP